MTAPSPPPAVDGRPRRGAAPVLIIVPSLVSAFGIAFVLVGLLVNQQIVQDIFLCLGVILLWIDFFVTMAIFRYSVRSIDGRLRVIERELLHRRQEDQRQQP